MTYNPLTQIYRLGSDTDVNYMIATRKSEWCLPFPCLKGSSLI
jgi:hypothetical protein